MGALEYYESDVQVPTGEWKQGAFGVKFCWKNGLLDAGAKKNGVFFDVDSQKWGSFSLQKCNFKPKFANLMSKLLQNRTQKFCNLYVKFDTKVEKRGSLGVGFA